MVSTLLEEIIGLEECVNLTSLHLEDSTNTKEGQNEKWGYFDKFWTVCLHQFYMGTVC